MYYKMSELRMIAFLLVLYFIIFHQASCGNYELISVSCDDTWMYFKTKADNIIHCAMICDLNDRCLGLSFVDQISECKLYDKSLNQCSEKPEADISYYRKIREERSCSFSSYGGELKLSQMCGVSFIRTPLVFRVQTCRGFNVHLWVEGRLNRYSLGQDEIDAWTIHDYNGTRTYKYFYFDFGNACTSYQYLWMDLTSDGSNANFTVGTGSVVGSNVIFSRIDEWRYHYIDEIELIADHYPVIVGNWTFYEQI